MDTREGRGVGEGGGELDSEESVEVSDRVETSETGEGRPFGTSNRAFDARAVARIAGGLGEVVLLSSYRFSALTDV